MKEVRGKVEVVRLPVTMVTGDCFVARYSWRLLDVDGYEVADYCVDDYLDVGMSASPLRASGYATTVRGAQRRAKRRLKRLERLRQTSIKEVQL